MTFDQMVKVRRLRRLQVALHGYIGIALASPGETRADPIRTADLSQRQSRGTDGMARSRNSRRQCDCSR
jgi:hypothetical protein